jgi:hypothetical protein
MLKSNSKKACENIRAYIMEHFTPNDYTDNPPQEFPEIAAFILSTFRGEIAPVGAYAQMSERARFEEWCAGLPSVIDTCYYYNCSAVDAIADILEETDVEKAKYDEGMAEAYLSTLIYRELVKGCKA